MRFVPWTAMALVGCADGLVLPSEDMVSPPVQLVSWDAWERLEDEADPFVEERPTDVTCDTTAVVAEDDGLEIETDRCGWVTLAQPLQAPIEVGDAVEVVAWHDALIALEPAETTWAVYIDGALVWERVIAIPGAAAAYTDLVDSPLDAAPGAEVLLHLRNHGSNTYRFQDLSRAAR